MTAIVLDASAAVEIVMRTASGRRGLDHLRGRRIFVPEHFYTETSGVLRRLSVVQQEITTIEADRHVQAVCTLSAVRVSLRPLMSEAWALRHNLTMPDAFYVVIARSLAAPLLTGDRRLAGGHVVEGVDMIVI